MNDIPPTFDEILAARERLRPFLPPTALRSYRPLDEAVGLHVLVKHENHQPTNSFKIRNALAAMTALSGEQRRRGVIAATRGNHGAGIAWAGHALKIPAVVCVPVGNNPEKNAAIRGYGAELIERGQTYDDAIAVMREVAKERGLVEIHSTNNHEVLAGAGTLALEMFEQAAAMGETVDAMAFAVGGGSQAAGAITVARRVSPATAIYGVQSAAAPAYHDSFRGGKALAKTPAATIADGIATGWAYEQTFETLKAGLRDFVLVSEPELADAVRLLLTTTHNLAEGAGAAGLAGVRKIAESLRGKTAAVVVSGGNMDQPTLARVMNRAV